MIVAPAESDEYTGTVRTRLSKESLERLTRLEPWRSTTRIAVEWMTVIGAAWLCSCFWHPALYAARVFLIGSRFNALGVLMHEATHYRLFRNRKWNDWVGEIFLAWPILITLYGYRRNHFAHHRHLNTAKDPDWVRKQGNTNYRLPKTKTQILATCLKYAIGWYSVQDIKKGMADAKLSIDVPSSLTRAWLAFYLLLISASLYFGFFRHLLLYWIVPIPTVFYLLVYIRGVAEHFGDFAGGTHEDIFTQSRTTLFAPVEGYFMAPCKINYHIEHHLYPSVPYYHLPKLHQVLKGDAAYCNRAHLTDGFLKGLFHECQLLASPQAWTETCSADARKGPL